MITRSERGQALLEFALIAPIIFLFLLLIVDFGIGMDRRLTLQHATREGARYAAVHTDETAIKQRTVDQAQGLIGAADVAVCYIDGDDGNSTVGEPGDSVRVSASYTYGLAVVGPLLTGLFGGGVAAVDMNPSGTARLERTVGGAVACPP